MKVVLFFLLLGITAKGAPLRSDIAIPKDKKIQWYWGTPEVIDGYQHMNFYFMWLIHKTA